jgi:uncharacterized RDD family membrane protein YckC
MDNIRIQTTQNVDISYELASVGDRMIATVIDYLIFFVYILLCMLFFWIISYGDGFILPILLFLPLLLYDLLCEIFFNGKSFGKMAMKIKVVMLDGTQPGFSAYLLRWVLRLIDMVLFTPGLGLVVLLINGKGQRIGDMAAGTTVIKLKQKVLLSHTILNAQRPFYQIVYPEVSKLNDNDIDIIKDVMRHSLSSGNTHAIEMLAKKTKDTMGVNYTTGSVQFLATVVQDYSEYSFDR